MSVAFSAREVRRRLLQVGVCLAVGIVTTVAAAWSFALWSKDGAPSPMFNIQGVFGKDGKAMPFPQTAEGRGFGVRVEFKKHIESSSTPAGPMLFLADDSNRLASGWPFPAMEYRVIYGTNTPPPGLLTTQIGWNANGGPWLLDGVRPPQTLRAQPWRFLPLRPRALGFAANTGLVAGLVWCAAFGWRDARRLVRSRRERCLRCGYPVSGLARCPECGTEAASAARVLVLAAWGVLGRVFGFGHSPAVERPLLGGVDGRCGPWIRKGVT